MEKTSELIVKPSNKTITYWLNETFIPEALREQLNTANTLITPGSNYGDFKFLHFPLGTDEIFHFLSNRKLDNFVVDICINDEDYKELGLHSDLIVLPDFIVLYIAAPILSGLLVEYIKYKLGSHITKATIKANVTITDEKAKRSVSLSYDGNANDFEKIAGKTLSLIDSPLALACAEDTADLEYEERIRRLTEIHKNEE